MGSVPPSLLIGSAVACVGVLLHIIGLSTRHWIDTDLNRILFKIEGSTGLFEYCIQDRCDKIEDPPGKLEAVRALVIIGMIAGGLGAALALLLVFLRLISKGTPKLLTLFSTAACFVAFIVILVGVIVYATDIYNSDVGDLGYSFALCVVAAMFLAGGGSLVFVGGKDIG